MRARCLRCAATLNVAEGTPLTLQRHAGPCGGALDGRVARVPSKLRGYRGVRGVVVVGFAS
jgi:hypothetical protein